jgi:hypothetical protein
MDMRLDVAVVENPIQGRNVLLRVSAQDESMLQSVILAAPAARALSHALLQKADEAEHGLVLASAMPRQIGGHDA